MKGSCSCYMKHCGYIESEGAVGQDCGRRGGLLGFSGKNRRGYGGGRKFRRQFVEQDQGLVRKREDVVHA